jgi:DNA modification methylase
MQAELLSITEVPLMSDIDKEKLDIKAKFRTNPLPWKGQFSPQFVEVILSNFCTGRETVLDPFAGSGTVLYEALRKGINSVGLEINPAAFILSRLYKLSLLSKKERKNLVDSLEGFLIEAFGKADRSFKESLSSVHKKILQIPELKIIFEAYVVLLDLGKPNFAARALKTWHNLKRLVLTLPHAESLVDIFLSDARATPLEADSVSFVLTSPPYVNVINYHQQYRRSVEFLGYEVLNIAKAEIGSNRKFRSNRFLTVVQYSLDMALVLKELIRLCKLDSYILFVVGRNSTVRGIPIPNSDIILSLAMPLGLLVEGRYERSYLNRYGQMIVEDILIVKNSLIAKDNLGHDEKFFLEIGKATAYGVLKSCLKLSKDREVFQDIEKALSSIDLVKPSPQAEVRSVST